ncbi:MAG: TIR domain-containing protein [Chloroflexota bacterium]|nr:TIR domain-containing protein [Chloroflexota bacterium]
MTSLDSKFIPFLEKVRADFDHARFACGPVKVMLTHRATNAEAEGVVGNPRAHGEVIAYGSAGHRECRQRFDKDGGALFRTDPIVDVAGNPVVNSAGDAYDIEMPAFRSVEFTGQVADYQKLSSLSERAGRLVSKLGSAPALGLLAGWRFSKPEDLWWALLFELAWAKRHPLVTAQRRIWMPSETPNVFYPYDIDALRHLIALGPDGMGKSIPAGWLKRLPEAFVSELDDVAAASFDTADYLLGELNTQVVASPENTSAPELASASRTSRQESLQRRFAIALSFPGEKREVVGGVAKLLAKVFGESRVFYDRFHEVELSRPNLDLVLQRIYSDESDLVVVFVCGDYKDKEWCGIEWRAIRELLKSRSRADQDLMFLRLDMGSPPGMLSLDGYLEISKKNPRQIADIILQRWCATR